MDANTPSVPHRLEIRPADDHGSAAASLSTPVPAAGLHHGKMNGIGAVPAGGTCERLGATSSHADPQSRNSAARHPLAVAGGAGSRAGSYHMSIAPQEPSDIAQSQLPQKRQHVLSRAESKATRSTNDADPVFTPPASGGRLSPGTGSAQESSQESQLLQLSEIAAAQERIPEDTADASGGNGLPRKRMADGMVKHSRDKSSASPGQIAGHSRTTSAVSMASTSGSRIGELSAELKTRLSYAMVKVNHGWQSHSIDQVETLASQAASPASSASTIHLRNGSSASPQLSNASHRGSNNSTPATGPQHHFPGRPGEAQTRESSHSTSRAGSTSPVKTSQGLAPPVSIQPAQNLGSLRRGSNPRHPPPFLSVSHQASPHTGSHSPGQPSPYPGAGRHRTVGEGILVSPHTNVREQDAIESLLFMSSPGNSANLKHAFPSSSSQPLPSGHGQPQRTALPTSQPRKSLPTGRPTHHARSQSQTLRRIGSDKSAMEMDIDEPLGTPMSRGTPRRRVNGSHGEAHAPVPRLKHLPLSSGLTVPSRPRPPLADEDIDRMLDRAAAAEDSDSDGEIQIPVQKVRRDGAHTL